MKNMIKLAVAGALIATGAVQTQAQSSTNAVLGATFALTAFVQTSDNIVKNMSIKNKDILAAIGNDLNGQTNSFSRRAALLAVPSTDSSGVAGFWVKDGDTITDVSEFLLVNQVSDPVTSTRGNNTFADTILEFRLRTSTLAFDVQGFATVKLSPFTSHGTDFGTTVGTVNCSAAGSSGNVSGDSAVLKGSVNASGRKVSPGPS